jgi:hypothetical protein
MYKSNSTPSMQASRRAESPDLPYAECDTYIDVLCIVIYICRCEVHSGWLPLLTDA